MVNDGEQRQSKYNSGINIIMRLDELWKDTHTYSRRGNFQRWNSTLDRIWLELARDISDNDWKDKETKTGEKIEGYKSQFESFDERIIKEGNFNDTKDDDFEKLSPEKITKRAKQYKILLEKELFLRRLENKLGKGTAFDDGEDYTFT